MEDKASHIERRTLVMLLSRKSTVKLNDKETNLIGHMCFAAYKLWNVCNYERKHYKELSLPVKYPDWYYQKKAHKDNLWYKQLPSQTAQEVCKILDKSWKSYYALKKSGGIKNPHPPRYKQDNIAITYMQNAIVHDAGTATVRLTLSKQLKKYMSEKYDICEEFLFLKNKFFENTDNIKQIKIYPPADGECAIIIIYEVPDVKMLDDNGRYLGIDPGMHNLMTCYNSVSGETFIVGRRYLSLCHRFNKEISRIQSQWAKQQAYKGVKYPKTSKHLSCLYKRKNDAIKDYLHKVTRSIVNYCVENDLHTVVIGDISGIRKDKNLGHITNQKLHALPYKRIYEMLKYKLALEGIKLVKQKERYTSQTSPFSPAVNKKNARKANRIQRGRYKDGNHTWNADCVGAFNIVRLYTSKIAPIVGLDPLSIKEPYILKVAV